MAEHRTVDAVVVGSTPIIHPKKMSSGRSPECADLPLFFAATSV